MGQLIDDSDYIPFEPFRSGPSTRRARPGEIEQVKDTIRRIKERRRARQAAKGIEHEGHHHTDRAAADDGGMG
ncbi:hypothetical protein [Bradyrhizobium elkanii]|uniref:hypothetical protein n=1 Tax=Bradyrhizobium elkanii TaxID=29448 RepID=UPI003516CC19